MGCTATEGMLFGFLEGFESIAAFIQSLTALCWQIAQQCDSDKLLEWFPACT